MLSVDITLNCTYLWDASESTILYVLPQDLNVLICVLLVAKKQLLWNNDGCCWNPDLWDLDEILQTGQTRECLNKKLHGVQYCSIKQSLAIVLAGEEVLDGNIMPVLLGSGVIPTELPGR